MVDDRRVGDDRRRDRDRATARRIPDEFAQTGGDSSHRISGLVSRHWPNVSPGARSDLCQRLGPTLSDLLKPGTPVTDRHRDRCEDIVLEWLEGAKRYGKP